MGKFINFFKSKLFIAILLIIVIIAIAAVTIVFFVTRPDGLTIKHLPQNDIEHRRISDYKDSRLKFYDNDTFTLEIVYLNYPELVGIGKYVKNGDNYEFTYIDMWRRVGTKLEKDTEYSNWTITYTKTKKGIEVKCPNNRLYYFK